MAIGKPPAQAGRDGDPDPQDDGIPWYDREDPPVDPHHPSLDTSVAHQARMYDYLLGGKDNFEADREAGDAVIAMSPDTVYAARANRAFLGRVVRHLAGEAGIRQFLDIGTGIPSPGSTHEVAQAAAPGAKVVYVDYDPVVLSYAYALLTSGPQGSVDYIDADVRDTSAILAKAARTLDFSQPVAVTMLLLLHAIPDSDDPWGIVATIMEAMPSGSYVAVSHSASDIDPDLAAKAASRLNDLSHQQYTFRSHDQVLRFFNGMEMVEPGLTQVHQWRPDAPAGQRATGLWAGVGRKP